MVLKIEDVTVLYRPGVKRTWWNCMKRLLLRSSDTDKEDTPGLRNITCAFTGGVNIILGPNGSGKTTLLEVLAGLSLSLSGSLTLDGKIADRPVLRSVIGYLPQTFGLYPNLTAREMLYYIALLKGLADSRTRERSVETVLQQTGLLAVAERRVGAYSRGMRQKVGIAQALLGDPPVLLLDEPTAGLAPEDRNKLRGLLAQLGQDRMVVLASSILTDICCADRVLVLDQGKKRFWGTPLELAACAWLQNEPYPAGEEMDHDRWTDVLEKGYRAALLARVSK